MFANSLSVCVLYTQPFRYALYKLVAGAGGGGFAAAFEDGRFDGSLGEIRMDFFIFADEVVQLPVFGKGEKADIKPIADFPVVVIAPVVVEDFQGHSHAVARSKLVQKSFWKNSSYSLFYLTGKLYHFEKSC